MTKFTNSFRRTLIIIPKHLQQSIKEVANILKILKFPNFVLYTQKISLANGYSKIEKLLLSKKCDSFILFNQKKAKDAFSITFGRLFNNFLLHSIKISIPIKSLKVTTNKADYIDSAVPVFSFIVEQNELLKSMFIDLFRNSYEFNEFNLFQKLVILKEVDNKFKLTIIKLNTYTKKIQEEYLSMEFTIAEENNLETEDILKQAHPKEDNKIKKKSKLKDDDIHGKVGKIYTTKQNLNEINRHKRLY